MISSARAVWLACLTLATPLASAATYTVGPTGRQYTQLSQVFTSRDLAPGDIVEVDGNATYTGGIVVGENDGGAPGNPVVIRWNRATGTSRPVLQGGQHTIKFQRANHVVFEGFEVRGGTSTCVFSEAHDVTVRDALITACPSHGILGADQNSGSFTLEYSEISQTGAGTTRHSVYMQSDEVAYPGARFVMRHNYLHSPTGGNLLKVRHERSQIHYNWFEGAIYQAMELIGPDCQTQQAAWTPDLKREDIEVLGNVIVHTTNWRNAIRVGGDLNGRSQGRARLVNNTIIFDRAGIANAVMVQLGQESLEMHNNLVFQTSAGSSPSIVYENPASDVEAPYCAPLSRDPWTSGRKVEGSNNWVQSGAQRVPSEWRNTYQGSDPMLGDIAQRRLRPRAGSPLLGRANPTPTTPLAFPYPEPTAWPLYDPPARAKQATGAALLRLMPAGGPAIGAFEQFGSDESTGPIRVNGAHPLIPGSVAPVQAAVLLPAPSQAVARPASTLSGSPPSARKHARGWPWLYRLWVWSGRWWPASR
jgi:hypothetical protein